VSSPTNKLDVPPCLSLLAGCAGLVAASTVVAPAVADGRPVVWQEREAAGPSRVAEAMVGARKAVRFIVRPGDSPVHSGERTERVASVGTTGAVPGTTQVYRWATRFPADFTPVPDSTWNIFMQWHGSAADGCHPNIALQVNTALQAARLRLQVRGGGLGPGCAPAQSRSWDFAPLERGRWEDFGLAVRWSDEPGGGFVELRLGGTVVVPRTPLATLYAGQRAYLKQGYYRAPSALTSTVFQTGVSVVGP
jgi:hypothetical protein